MECLSKVWASSRAHWEQLIDQSDVTVDQFHVYGDNVDQLLLW